MKKTLFIAIGLLIGIVIGTIWVASYAQAAIPPSTVPQGGTGWGLIGLGNLLIGGGDSLPGSLRLATSSALKFATSTGTLTVTYASTTAISSVTATTTNFFGGNLSSCSGSNFLQWSSGLFSCAASASGSVFPFTPSSYNGQTVNATSTGIWLTGSPLSLIASSTFATNATTTTLFSSVASSTNLYSQQAQIGTLTLSDALTVSYGGTGAKTLTGCLTGNGTGAITGSGTCNTSAASVTSITFGTGLSGGAITTSGTVALLSYLATSSAETATRIPVWSSTAGTPATLGGGFSGYTLASGLLTATNASTTALTVGTYFQPPNQATSPTNTAAASLVINTNGQASSSVAIGDGTNTNNIFAVHSFSVTFASSTLTYYGAFGSAGTTTTLVANPTHSSTLLSAYCKTDQGTAYVVFGNGTASTTAFQCTASGAQSTISSNNTWKGRQLVLINLGNSASAPNLITVTADVIDSN
jgi:hypothetical protein